MPEVASLAWRSKRTGVLNQPAAFAGRSGVAPTMTGAVASYLSPYPSGLLTLPALSMQVPLTDAVALSSPPYVGAVQLATPDVWSLPLNAIPTARLYQPSTSAACDGDPPVTAGAVLSSLIVTSTVAAV